MLSPFHTISIFAYFVTFSAIEWILICGRVKSVTYSALAVAASLYPFNLKSNFAGIRISIRLYLIKFYVYRFECNKMKSFDSSYHRQFHNFVENDVRFGRKTISLYMQIAYSVFEICNNPPLFPPDSLHHAMVGWFVRRNKSIRIYSNIKSSDAPPTSSGGRARRWWVGWTSLTCWKHAYEMCIQFCIATM